MRRLPLLFIVWASACNTPASLPSESAVIPVPVAEFASFGEGVVFESDSVGYLTDLVAGVIHRFTLDGRLTEWARSAQPNGHRILADGTHLVADGAEHAVLRFGRDGKRLAPLTMSDGSALIAPNDLTLDDSGGVYFTDPRDSQIGSARGTVHYVDRAGVVTTVARRLAWPNGIAVDPSGAWLYVNESVSGRVLRYAIRAPGRLGAVEVFAVIAEHLKPTEKDQQTLDGMTFDRGGNLYIAYHRVGRIYVLDRDGQVVRRYNAGQVSVSNVAFGGPGLQTLYAVGARGSDFTHGVLTRMDLAPVRGWSERSRWASSR